MRSEQPIGRRNGREDAIAFKLFPMASAPRHLRIFLASPGDVADEREIALQVLDDLPYDPLLRGKITFEDVAWDKRGAGAPILAGVTPQDSIKRGLPLPADCDIVVVIFWSRMGTPLPPPYQKEDGSPYESGTEWEYHNAVSAFREHDSPPVLLYRRIGVTLNADAPDFEERRSQYEKLKRFFADPSIGGYTRYDAVGDFRERLEHDLKSLIARILEKPDVRHAAPNMLPEPWKGSPFPGLRAFTAEDAPIFFGREREIDALVARIQEHPFVAVVGASGSGKSSLVAAGVIPRLQLNAGSAGAEEWLVLQLTPDRLGAGDPFASLAAAILHALPQTRQKGFAAKLRDEPELFASILPRRTLVFVDQFEELFTTVQASLRAPFVEVLQRVRSIITVRADFYGHCVEMPALARLVEYGTFPLAAPGVAALYDMISRPAARAALAFEEGLPQRILDDTGQEPGALALMAYTLDELYRRGLTHAAYEALGCVHGAIGKRSESVFAVLGEEEQAALPRVFRELVEVDERGTATRQRAPLARVVAMPAARRLTDALTEARLFVHSRGENGEPVVEVAHEALFRSWPRLAEWIHEASDDLRLLRQVRTAAVEWDRSGRRDHFLWPHERLEPVYAMHDRMSLDGDSVVKDFVRPESERIIRALQQGGSEVRQRAMIQRLAEIGAPAARSLVECLQYAATPSVRFDIYETLIAFGTEAVQHLLNAAIDEDFHWRHFVIEALIHVDPNAGRHLVERLLKADTVEIRAAAAILAAHARAEDMIPSLCKMIEDDSSDVCRAALIALATFKSRLSLDLLIRIARYDSTPLQVTAIDLLGYLGGLRETEEIAVLHDYPDKSGLRKLIGENWLLQDLELRGKVTAILAPLQGEFTIDQIAATQALQRLVGTPAIEACITKATTPRQIRRFLTIVVTADGSGVDRVLRLLDKGDRRVCVTALNVIRDSAKRVVAGSARWPYELGRNMGLDRPMVVKRIHAMTKHSHADVRRAATAALVQIRRLPLVP